MRRRAGRLGAFAVVTVLGVLAFVLVLVLEDTPKAFTLGVKSGGPVLELRAGQVGCQRPIQVPPGGSFDRLRLKLGTYERPGPPLDITVHRSDGDIIAHGTLAAGYPDITVHPTYVVDLDREVREGTRNVSVCVQNGGPGRVALYGNGDAAAAGTTAFLDDKPAGVDVDIIFERGSRSYASELGTILDRAVLFRSPRVSGVVLLLLLIALVGGAFAAVAGALRSAGDGVVADRPAEPPAAVRLDDDDR